MPPRRPKPKATLNTDYVEGQHGYYYAPSIETVDRRLAELNARVQERGDEFPALAESWRRDIDRLLDRRAWLSLMKDS